MATSSKGHTGVQCPNCGTHSRLQARLPANLLTYCYNGMNVTAAKADLAATSACNCGGGAYPVGPGLQHPRRTKLHHQPQPACVAGHTQPGKPREHQELVPGRDTAGSHGLCDLTGNCRCCRWSRARCQLHAQGTSGLHKGMGEIELYLSPVMNAELNTLAATWETSLASTACTRTGCG